jgi:uridine kinase
MLRPFVIGIGGPSGSGKTYLTERLALARPGAFSVLSLDSYYLPLDHLTQAEREGVNFDHPDALDWVLAEEHLVRLRKGEAVESPVYRFEVHTRAAAGVRVEPREYVLVEGILTLHHAGIRSLLDLKVYVETTDGECYRRRLERDVCERGRTRESVERQYRATVGPMAVEFVVPSRRWADLTVAGDGLVEESVGGILERVRAD